jgi:two-component system chemotaxis family response regulator WspR
VPETAFPSCALLPDCLSDELAEGYLAFQLLSVSSGVLGYLLVDHPFGYVATAEALQRDLGRTFEAIFSTEELKRHSDMLEELVQRRTADLEVEIANRRRTEQELKRVLATDALTGIANRRAFQKYYEEQWRVHVAAGDELALLMVDVDVFKAYNDHYGHIRGDEALCTVARCLQRSVRYPQDLASRFGGEEFTVVLPRCGRQGALMVARRFRELLACAAVPHAASSVASVVTASIGIAVMNPSTATPPDSLLAAADRALYLAKEQGRNQIVGGGAGFDHSAVSAG